MKKTIFMCVKMVLCVDLQKLNIVAYIQKINADTITVTMKSPLLALMRGHRVNFIRYTNDDKIENKIKTLEEAGFADRNVESNISLKEYEITEPSDNGKFVIDRTSSGQYLILSVNITYTNNNWEYILTLAKPASTKTSILKQCILQYIFLQFAYYFSIL